MRSIVKIAGAATIVVVLTKIMLDKRAKCEDRSSPYRGQFHTTRDCFLQSEKDLSGGSVFVPKDTILEVSTYDDGWFRVKHQDADWYIDHRDVYHLILQTSGKDIAPHKIRLCL